MFTIIGDVIACAFWGTVISLTICVLFYLCIKLFYPTYSISISSGITLSALAIFLFIQSFLLVGANYIKNYADGIGNIALSVVSGTEDTVRLMATNVQNTVNTTLNVADEQVDIVAIKNALVAEYPMLSKYIDGWESLQGIALNVSPTQIAAAVVDSVTGEINDYIWRRVFWMLGALVVTTLGVCLLITPGANSNRAHSSRETRRTPRTHSAGIRRSHSSSRYR